MNDNLTIILEEFEQWKGQLMLTQRNNVQRLVGVGTDEEDYYWIFYDGRRLNWESCVGRIIPLKGHITDENYKYLSRLCDLNYVDKVLQRTPHENYTREQYIAKLSQVSHPDKLLTDLYFDDAS